VLPPVWWWYTQSHLPSERGKAPLYHLFPDDAAQAVERLGIGMAPVQNQVTTQSMVCGCQRHDADHHLGLARVALELVQAEARVRHLLQQVK